MKLPCEIPDLPGLLRQQLQLSEAEAEYWLPAFQYAWELFDRYIQRCIQIIAAEGKTQALSHRLRASAEWKAMMQSSLDCLTALAALVDLVEVDFDIWDARWCLQETLDKMARQWTDTHFALYLRARERCVTLLGTLEFVRSRSCVGSLSPPLQAALEFLWHRRDRFYRYDREKLKELIANMLGLMEQGLMLPDELWTAQAIAWINEQPELERERWKALLRHAGTASSARPTAAWKQEAQKHLDEIGVETFHHAIKSWSALFVQQSYDQICVCNVPFLLGLLHCCRLQTEETMAQTLTDLAIACFRRGTSGDPHPPVVGTVCLGVLKEMPGNEPIRQLARLQAQVRRRGVLNRIRKAYEQAAKQRGLQREDLEEMFLPPVDISADGVLSEIFGEYTAQAHFSQGKLSPWEWSDRQGKRFRGVPKPVKTQFADEWKTLQQSAQELVQLYARQCQRLEGLLCSGRVWLFPDWQASYLQNPLLNHIARRLIWEFQGAEQIVGGIWHGDGFVDAEGLPLDLSEITTLRLWHPVERPVEEVLRWRRWIETHAVTQPFPQAHREIYLLTEAERETYFYSARFANHVLAARRFGQLRSRHNWRFERDPTILAAYISPYGGPQGHSFITMALPSGTLRAELWLEYVGERDERIAITEQVRFVDADRNPLPLESIPSRLFSEVMRNMDFLISNTSIATDPDWRERIEEGEYRDYWQRISFGALNDAANTRRDLLTCLLPRLRIASRCTLEEQFLKVRGDLRTYKIHLGSGNVLMEPNDQYLCIVPDRQATSLEERGLCLPFEGDSTLASILSKALLLAEDNTVTDSVILSQLNRFP